MYIEDLLSVFQGTHLRFFPPYGSKPGSVHHRRFCALLFPAINERKDLKSLDFRSFMVAAAGLEPAASGL